MSKNPLERAWPQWDQRRLSNRREQILHFDLSRKGREAIKNTGVASARHRCCPYTYPRETKEERKKKNARGPCESRCDGVAQVELTKVVVSPNRERTAALGQR